MSILNAAPSYSSATVKAVVPAEPHRSDIPRCHSHIYRITTFFRHKLSTEVTIHSGKMFHVNHKFTFLFLSVTLECDTLHVVIILLSRW